MARLSPGQIECLLLVDQHHNSKEIAAKLGISPHTVDQRIRGALDKLGWNGAERRRGWWWLPCRSIRHISV